MSSAVSDGSEAPAGDGEGILGPKPLDVPGERQAAPHGRKAFRFLARDSLLYGAAGAANRLSKIVLVPIVASAYPAAVYGAFDSLGVYLYVAAVLAVGGLSSAVVIIATQKPDVERAEALREPASSSLRLVVGFSVVLSAIVLLAAEQWSRLLLGSAAYATTVRWAAASIPASATLLYCLSLLQWSFRRRAYVLVSLGSATLTIALTWLVAVHTSWGLDGFFIANFAAQAAGAVAALTYARSMLGGGWSGPVARAALAIGLPFAVIGVAGTLLPSIDRLFLVNRYTLEAAGLYGLGQKIATLSALALAGFQAAWGPFAFSYRHDPDRHPLFRAVFLAACTAAAGIALVLTALAPSITRVIASAAYAPATIFVGPLALSAGLGAVFVVVAIGSVMEGRSLHNLFAYVGGLAVTLTLNFGLAAVDAPPLAIAWANVAGQASAVVLMAILSQRVHPLPYPFLRGFLVLAGAAMLIPLVAHATAATSALGGVAIALLLVLAGATAVWWLLLDRATRQAATAWLSPRAP